MNIYGFVNVDTSVASFHTHLLRVAPIPDLLEDLREDRAADVVQPRAGEVVPWGLAGMTAGGEWWVIPLSAVEAIRWDCMNPNNPGDG